MTHKKQNKYTKTYDSEQLKNKLLYYINYRIRSKKEVYTKLQSLNATTEQITNIINELEQIQLINDEKFIVFFIRDLVENKQYGAHRIVIELQKKGFDLPLIKTTISEYFAQEEYSPIENIILLLQQKYQYAKTFPEEHKIIAFLGRRGFSYTDIKKALKQFSQNSSNFIEDNK